MDYFVLRFDGGYGKDDFVALQKLYQKKMLPWWKYVFAIIMLLAGAIIVVEGILLLALGNIGQGLFSLALGLLLALLFLFRARVNAWSARRNMAKMENMTIKLSADHITETNAGAMFQVPYGNVERVFYYRERYFLFLDKRHAHILPEAHFAVGDPKDFSAFIEDRTGKQVEYI